jgi:hypothetical protein
MDKERLADAMRSIVIAPTMAHAQYAAHACGWKPSSSGGCVTLLV